MKNLKFKILLLEA